MTDLSKMTKQMLRMLPSWMKIRKDPDSIGAQFLDVFGLELTDISEYLDHQLNNQFIGSVNLGEIAYIYRTKIPYVKQSDNLVVTSGTQELTREYKVYDFYAQDEDAHVFIVNNEAGILYTRRNYDSLTLTINNQESIPLTLNLHHVWNCFDEFGLLLGLHRLYGEDNLHFKERILDVFKRPGNATRQGLQNSIGRELGIASEHVRLNNLMDAAFIGTMLNQDGSASKTLKGIVERIGTAIPVTWNNAVWDRTYWQTAGEDMLGLDYLPHVWDLDTDGWEDKDFQSGIGDRKDLEVRLPEEHKDEQTFDYFVGLQGVDETTETVYVPHSFSYQIKVQGLLEANVTPPITYYYTIEASEVIPLLFTIRAYSQYVEEIDIDFSDPSEYTIHDDTIEIVPGNEIMSPAKRYVRILATLETGDNQHTPILDSIELHWKDGEEFNTTTISTESDWTNNVNTLNTDAVSDTLRLTQGSYQNTIESDEQWEEGTHINITIDDGIRLTGLIS